MKYTPTPFQRLIFLICFFISALNYAVNSDSIEKQANYSIEKLYNKQKSNTDSSMTDRIEWFSSQFLDEPYLLGSLGEGPGGTYDQFPKYRVDGFDCETYVDTVLALALTSSFNSFQQCINNIRYKNGHVSYLLRNHFTGLDWNQNNQSLRILKDITLHIKDRDNKSVALIAEASINKPNWYAFKTRQTIRIKNSSPIQEEKLLAELKKKGAQLKISLEKVPYIPFTALFFANNKPDMYLFAQIPHGSIIEIIRPNWDLSQQIGTALNISHLGFAIRKNNQLYFRQASSEYHKVVDVPLIEYLEKAQKSPTIKGINVQIVLPKKPLRNCKIPV